VAAPEPVTIAAPKSAAIIAPDSVAITAPGFGQTQISYRHSIASKAPTPENPPWSSYSAN
jgi:hypothetical protein